MRNIWNWGNIQKGVGGEKMRLPAWAGGRNVSSLLSFILSVPAGVAVCCICRWLDGKEYGILA